MVLEKKGREQALPESRIAAALESPAPLVGLFAAKRRECRNAAALAPICDKTFTTHGAVMNRKSSSRPHSTVTSLLCRFTLFGSRMAAAKASS